MRTAASSSSGRDVEANSKEGIEAMLAHIAPHDVKVSATATIPAHFELTDEELVGCSRFSEKRMRDFAIGRYCASEALRMLGRNRRSVAVGRNREPVWPAGVVGSISHTTGIAGAVVASNTRYQGLGLDLERLQPIGHLAKEICRPEELDFLEECHKLAGCLNIVFSAKEAVYKCAWPMVRRFVGFHEVELSIDFPANRFRVVRFENADAGLRLVHGRWAVIGDVIAAVALLEQPSACCSVDCQSLQ